MVKAATLQEIFSGIQGEGTLVGYRQLFVRFHGCDLHCRYCDTPASQGPPPPTCLVEEAAASRRFLARPNPLTPAEVLAALERLQAGFPHHSVSLTGGEPLQQRAFLDVLIPALHARGLRTFLETNGLLAREMAALACPPHYIAMDVKLPSAAGTPPAWEAHAAFLKAAREAAPEDRLQVKVVFAEESLAEVARAAALLAAVDATIPCILQPVTPRPGGLAAPTANTVLEAQRLAAARLAHVRVIPQTHVMLGQR